MIISGIFFKFPFKRIKLQKILLVSAKFLFPWTGGRIPAPATARHHSLFIFIRYNDQTLQTNQSWPISNDNYLKVPMVHSQDFCINTCLKLIGQPGFSVYFLFLTKRIENIYSGSVLTRGAAWGGTVWSCL